MCAAARPEPDPVLLKALLDLSEHPLVYLDPSFVILYLNRSYAEACRRLPEELLGRNHFELYPHAENEAIFARARDTGEPAVWREKPFVFPDQPERGVTYWDWRLTPVKDETGRVQGLVFSLNEVTDKVLSRERVEQLVLRLQELVDEANRSRAQLESVFEAIGDGVFVFDREGIRLANEAAARMTGYASAAELKQDMAQLARVYELAADGRPLSPAEWPVARVLAGESFAEWELQARRRDTGQHWLFRYSGAPVRDAEGRVVLAVTVLREVTAERRAEQELREATARERARADELQTVLDAVPAAVWIARDPRGDFITGNRQSFRTLRLPEGSNQSRTAPPPERPANFRSVRNGVEIPGERLPVQRAARGEEVWNEDLDVVFDDGSVTHLVGNAVPLRDDAGRPRGSVAAFVDISDRRRMEQELREADRRKNEFLAVLSHELRNPLTPVQNGLYILEHVEPGSEQAQRAQQIVRRQVAQLVRLVDDLLDLTRITQGKIRLQLEPLDLGELVRRVVEDHRPQFEQDGIGLELKPAAGPLRVLGDGSRLTQAIGNLLHNAAKFTPPGGAACVSLRAERDAAVVCVSDTGAGIAPEFLQRVFQPFAQADATLERSRSGLGLGLALVKQLVELHGGKASVHSDGLGRGASFTVRLPLEPATGAR